MSLVPRLSPKRLNDILSRKVIEVGANVTLVGVGPGRGECDPRPLQSLNLKL